MYFPPQFTLIIKTLVSKRVQLIELKNRTCVFDIMLFMPYVTGPAYPGFFYGYEPFQLVARYPIG